MLENSVCAVPLEHFPNGLYSVGRNVSTLTYHCNDGFILMGARQRHCLPNQTWSEQIPRCVGKQLRDLIKDVLFLHVIWHHDTL